ncbi:hypothetical protein D3C78_1514670 [compost metagenome]
MYSRLEGSTGRMRLSSTHWRIFASFILAQSYRLASSAAPRVGAPWMISLAQTFEP